MASTFKKVKVFSNGTEYEIFKDNYCYNECKFHKQNIESGFPEYIENGGCPIEDGMEVGRFDPGEFLEVWEGNKCINWHHCPFYTKEEDNE